MPSLIIAAIRAKVAAEDFPEVVGVKMLATIFTKPIAFNATHFIYTNVIHTILFTYV
jgi:hypothetical protein